MSRVLQLSAIQSLVWVAVGVETDAHVGHVQFSIGNSEVTICHAFYMFEQHKLFPGYTCH